MMEILNSLLTGSLSILVILFVLVFMAILTVVAVYIIKERRKWSEFACVIWFRDGFGQLTEKYDKAGIFVDGKTKNKRLFLKRSNVGLDPDNVPYVPAGSKKVVYLLQTGLKNFHYIQPVVANPDITLTVGEEDVNWAINAYERQKKLFNLDKLMQYLPFILLAFVSMIILIMFIYLFRKLDVIKEIGQVMKETAEIMARARTGTAVVP